TDIPLTTHGEDAARQVGLRLRNIHFQHVFTSPLQRAQRTCALAGLEPTAEVEPDLAEWNYGDYEGRTSADIDRSRPGWNLFRDGAPHGETPAQISNRADQLIARLRRLDGNVALFSHGHFGRLLGVRWIALPVQEAQHFQLGTASLSVLGYEHDRTGLPVISFWNSTEHGTFDPEAKQTTVDTKVRQPAIERWENEGGETSPIARETKPTQGARA
ncbi:MAG: histidine phosphatase family protein, partial [Acidobacteriota bacterium]